LYAGEIGKLWGLREIRVGDVLGQARVTAGHHFAPPTMETVVVADRSEDKQALWVALTQLAEQDPLINIRRDDARQEIALSVYGEVQKEVIQATLANDFGIKARFNESTTICIERPIRTGEAVEILHAESNPFLATIGLRVDPAPPETGIQFHMQVDTRTVPLYVYKNAENFKDNMDRYVRQALKEGLLGWQVTDCIVTMTRCGYSSADGPPSTRGPLSTSADFRKLTPMVLMQALERAGTKACEPIVRASLDIPAPTQSRVMSALARLGATADAPLLRGEFSTIQAVLPAARVTDLVRQLPRLTSGEGVLESRFAGYQPVSGEPPARLRTTTNPLHRAEYLYAS
jgi:ribosomal protection tetracycline resistance protein